jgi:hypothetical protein
MLTTNCTNEEEMTAVLTGFVPGEEVLLGRYDLSLETYKGVLAGYDYSRIGPDGTAVATLPRSPWLVAIGQMLRPAKQFGEFPTETNYIASAISQLLCFSIDLADTRID